MTSTSDRPPGRIVSYEATGCVGGLTARAMNASARQRVMHDFVILSAFRHVGATRAAITRVGFLPRGAPDDSDAIARRPVSGDST